MGKTKSLALILFIAFIQLIIFSACKGGDSEYNAPDDNTPTCTKFRKIRVSYSFTELMAAAPLSSDTAQYYFQPTYWAIDPKNPIAYIMEADLTFYASGDTISATSGMKVPRDAPIAMIDVTDAPRSLDIWNVGYKVAPIRIEVQELCGGTITSKTQRPILNYIGKTDVDLGEGTWGYFICLDEEQSLCMKNLSTIDASCVKTEHPGNNCVEKCKDLYPIMGERAP